MAQLFGLSGFGDAQLTSWTAASGALLPYVGVGVSEGLLPGSVQWNLSVFRGN